MNDFYLNIIQENQTMMNRSCSKPHFGTILDIVGTMLSRNCGGSISILKVLMNLVSRLSTCVKWLGHAIIGLAGAHGRAGARWYASGRAPAESSSKRGGLESDVSSTSSDTQTVRLAPVSRSRSLRIYLPHHTASTLHTGNLESLTRLHP